MRLLTDVKDVHKGDVVLVAQELKDKETGKPYIWRWYGLAVTARNRWPDGLTVIRLGADHEGTRQIFCRSSTIWLMNENEWPDGVWALRTKAFLEGRIDIT